MSFHIVPVRMASRTVHICSSAAAGRAPAEPATGTCRGRPPSTSRPMSSGCRRRNTAASGREINRNASARICHAPRQPWPSISHCVIGRKIIPPMPRPAVANASAFPRWRTNHLATGTEVTMPLGAAIPDAPMMPKSRMNCQAWLLMLTSSRHPQISRAERGMYTRAP